jgi:hypothetical protein
MIGQTLDLHGRFNINTAGENATITITLKGLKNQARMVSYGTLQNAWELTPVFTCE